jgi:hypothetical protein
MPMRQALEIYVKSLDNPPSITSLPIGLLRWMGRLSFNHELRSLADLMAHVERLGEEGDPAEAGALLGGPTTTLDQWIAGRQRPIAISAAN